MYLLLSPLKYWHVHHPVKRQWDIVLPAIGAIALTAALKLWPSVPSPFGATGFIAGLQSLYAILGGFFVAALTLLATSESHALSRPVSGWPRTTYGAESAPLTRRRFLCLLFGYLSFSAFGLYALGFAATLGAPGLRPLILPAYHSWLSGAFLLVYNFWLAHLAVTTLVGLYYFTDRLQRPDVEFVDHSGDVEPTAAE